MSERVVFLDIDGPMIPATMYLVDRMCSPKRLCPPTTIAVMNMLCKRSGAKIVFNTTHNNDWEGVDPIQVALVKQGLDADHIHPDPKTQYPKLERLEAVEEWRSRHPENKAWIAYDDSRFTEAPWLIWVDPDAGLHVGHLNEGLRWFNAKELLILM